MRGGPAITKLSKLVAACALASAFAFAQSSCNQQEVKRAAMSLTGGDPDRGAAAISRYGCAACHTIPGIRGADALVGPSLEHVGSRSYVGGVLPNTPDNVILWIQNPPRIDPLTAMPNLGVTEGDARDIAGYLYTLK
jgi:cytochrome c1